MSKGAQGGPSRGDCRVATWKSARGLPAAHPDLASACFRPCLGTWEELRTITTHSSARACYGEPLPHLRSLQLPSMPPPHLPVSSFPIPIFQHLVSTLASVTLFIRPYLHPPWAPPRPNPGVCSRRSPPPFCLPPVNPLSPGSNFHALCRLEASERPNTAQLFLPLQHLNLQLH